MLLPGLYVSDIFYGWLSLSGYEGLITPGVIIRGGIFLLAVGWSVKYHRAIGKRLFFLCWGLFLLALLGPMISFVETLNETALSIDMKGVFRVLYGPFILLLFIVLIKRYRMTDLNIFSFIEYAAYFLGCSLLLMQLLSIGKLTYGDYAYGSTGIFHAQNDLTLSLGIALIPAVYRNIKNPSHVRVALLIGSMFGCIGIGTRASIAIIFLVPVAVMFVILWSIERSQTGKKKFTRKIISVTMVLVLAVGASWIGFRTIQYESQYNYQAKKFETIAAGELPRLLLIRAGVEYLAGRNTAKNMLGEGSYHYQRGVYPYWGGMQDDSRKSVEVDWMDLYGSYGVVFTILLHCFYLMLLFSSSKRFFLGRSEFDGLVATVLLIYLGHSALAGHAMVSPIPSILIAAVGGLYLSHRRIRAQGISRARYRTDFVSGRISKSCM
jgi:hypothetical protein